MKITRIITVLILLSILFCSCASVTSISSKKVWRQMPIDLWAFFGKYLRDEELIKNNTYEKLNIFFRNCTTPKDFYDRIQECVIDANLEDYYSEFRGAPIISGIIDTLDDNQSTLFCHHQTILFAAGVKAVFSDYDEQNETFTLKPGYGDFKLEIWRSIVPVYPKVPIRTHVQLVINKWNGTEFFCVNNRIYNRLEVDNWENQYRGFNRRNDDWFFGLVPAKINSLFFTGRQIFPFLLV